jgi:queuine/archaeosine tRNA-ribosyltransferase
VVNAFHLSQRPGSRAVEAVGGIHALMDWRGPIAADSGGFQIFSLIRQNPKLGSITNKEAIFRTAQGGKAQHLSPEKSIQIQLRLGADILVCLDDCTHPDDPPAEQAASVARTIAWAERCKAELEQWLAARRPVNRDASASLGMTTEDGATPNSCPSPSGRGEGEGASSVRTTRSGSKGPSPQPSPQGRGRVAGSRPLLFAAVQGGADRELRRRCAGELVEMGFDGYGFGGWPFDSRGRLLTDILALTAELMPDDKPKYALGIGSPAALIACAKMGYDLFDCALPTRDARRGRLYVFRGDGLEHGRLYIRDAKHRRDGGPISAVCDCLCCRCYSRAYLHHLFAIRDALAWRLATIHNLRFYTTLIERLRG